MRIKLVINEQPRTTAPLLLYARKNGEYTRPIRASICDVRMEDMRGPAGKLGDEISRRKIKNHILPLPPIGHQAGKYTVVTAGHMDNKLISKEQADALAATNNYLIFPYCPNCELWPFTDRPWWEYAEAMDEHYGLIKAPPMVRTGEPTPEEIDERLDEFEENHGRLEVLSPQTLEKMAAGTLTESYLRKLKRI